MMSLCHNVSYYTEQYDVILCHTLSCIMSYCVIMCHYVSYIVIAYTEQYGSHLQAIVWICTVFKALDMEIPCE